jgi:nanoRNase/pAp phosphatase (c-di-AMP/oligoRNAs hydrolase)
MKLSAAERLRRFYDVFPGDSQVLVVVNADPDAMASAMAVKRLLWRRVAGVTLCNINRIQRPDNLAMIRLLGINMIPADQIDPGEFTRFVMVDSQPDHNEAFSKFRIHAIIDHHPDTGYPAGFSDIRPAFGATASMMTEYLRAAKIKPSAKLATGLSYAIKTDTSNFERKTLLEDLKAFQFLFLHANPHMARKIEQSEITLDFLKYFKSALETMKQRKGKIFVHLGQVPNPDVCVVIADFFMRVNSVRWSIVSGCRTNKLVVVLRNDGIRKNAGRVAKDSFEPLGSAGGHKNMARAEIPLPELQKQVDPLDDKKLLNWLIKHIEKNTGKK